METLLPSLRQRVLFGPLKTEGVEVAHLARNGGARLEHRLPSDDGGVLLMFNIAGQLEARRGLHTMALPSGSHGFVQLSGENWKMVLCRSQPHEVLTLRFSLEWLKLQLELKGRRAAETIWKRLGGYPGGSGDVRPMSVYDHRLCAEFLNPPVSRDGRILWFRARMLEMVSHFFFLTKSDETPFCVRQKHTAAARVERVKEILLDRLEDPPTLAELGREAACSPHYLSRTFSRATGMTIQRYLRRLRIEEAAHLLRNGRHNVTEAALAVGYNSLSHFSKAFCEVMGCCPCLYQGRNQIPPDKR